MGPLLTVTGQAGCHLSPQANIRSLEGFPGAALQLQVASWQGGLGAAGRGHRKEMLWMNRREGGPGRAGAGTLIPFASISTHI